jgi:hypothetical protein
MTEVSSLSIPEIKEEESESKISRITRSLGNKAIDLWGRDTILNTKEKLVTGLFLGTVAVGSAVAEYKYGQQFKNAPIPLGFLIFSGKHFFLGGMSARINAESRWNSIKGVSAISTAADGVAELFQSIIMTGLLHHGWENVGGFITPDQLNGSGKDLGASLISGLGVLGWSRWKDRGTDSTEAPPPPAIIAADDFHYDRLAA